MKCFPNIILHLDFHRSTPEKEKELFEAQSLSELKRDADQRPEKQEFETKTKPDNDNNAIINTTTTTTTKRTTANTNIKHVAGDLNAFDLYALPNKRVTKKTVEKHESKVCEIASDEEEKDDCDNSNDSIEDKDANKDLPFGWEKHEDNDGPYYWHIKSGTIQREPPIWPKELSSHSLDAKTPTSSLHTSPSLIQFQAAAESAYKYNQQLQSSNARFSARSYVSCCYSMNSSDHDS